MEILDLYAGIGWKGRKEILEKRGHKVTTLDFDPAFGCDITKDIMEVTDLGLYDFVWASPPCEKWSVMRIGKNWVKGTNIPKTEGAAQAIEMVKHTIKLLNESAKIGWVIENPMGKLRKMEFMQDFRKNTVSYCQYGNKNQKMTDIWYCGFDWKSRPACKNGDPCHTPAPRGSMTGTQGSGTYAEKSIVPLPLWIEIIEAVEWAYRNKNNLR